MRFLVTRTTYNEKQKAAINFYYHIGRPRTLYRQIILSTKKKKKGKKVQAETLRGHGDKRNRGTGPRKSFSRTVNCTEKQKNCSKHLGGGPARVQDTRICTRK